MSADNKDFPDPLLDRTADGIRLSAPHQLGAAMHMGLTFGMGFFDPRAYAAAYEAANVAVAQREPPLPGGGMWDTQAMRALKDRLIVPNESFLEGEPTRSWNPGRSWRSLMQRMCGS